MSPPPAASSSSKPGPPPPPARDESIPFHTVRLVDLDNKLSPPVPLSSILGTYNKTTHTLTIVSGLDTRPGTIPIVKLVDKIQVNEKQRAAKEKSKQKKAKRVEDVEIQVSWESAPGDVEHKLARAKGVLEDGDRVKLTFAHRSGGGETTKLTGGKFQAVLTSLPDRFLTTLSPISTEFKPPQIRKNPSGDVVHVLHLQASKEIRQAVVQEVEASFDRKGEEKKRIKEEKRLKEERRAERAREREEEMRKGREGGGGEVLFDRD